MSLKLAILKRFALVDGITDEVERAMKRSHQAVSPRINELVKLGYVERAGWSRKTKNKRNADVYCITKQGRTALAAMTKKKEK